MTARLMRNSERSDFKRCPWLWNESWINNGDGSAESMNNVAFYRMNAGGLWQILDIGKSKLQGAVLKAADP